MDTLVAYWNQCLSAIKSFIGLPPEVLLGIAGALLVLYIYLVIRHAYTPIALAKSDTGRIRVTRAALKSLVKTICKQVGLEKRVSIAIEFSRNKVNVSVRLGKVELEQNLTALVNVLQERLTESLRNTLGVENVGKVDILVSGFKGIKPFTPEPIQSSVEDPFADFESK